ncbi:activated Cdc42 kinase-like isoform X2 [Cylas formicarius]|uniref:activated Cdc42 kinase-like isoform X2 n=1 Tax=Cylas formicarius TaxID=197179 RepID=UPI002958D923|nr:activated Cdc42 kinase-like isoform X2 [Cylas formicarius]
MEGLNATIKKGPGLYEFLVEAELQHYLNSFKNTLKITHPSQMKFTTEGDLMDIGMSKPEMRRLRKYYDKHFPHNYLSKFKKLLTHRKQENTSSDACLLMNSESVCLSKSPKVSSKHIIPAASITINKELGMGEFGVVQQGVWCNEGERIQVAIKCLSRDRMQSNMVEFLKEASIMHNIDHPNIVRFFGVVLPNIEGSLMLVTELAPLRSLLECLKEPSLRSSFPVLTLCDFAYQICDGMQYLEASRLIHRDLAARNILVFSKNKVKISDFGLSRALGQGKDYYQTNFNVNLKLPIAWCAPECISYLRFTTASDVWAFGVTLWEMFSYGFQPWAALTGQQILEAIDEPNFQRLEQPDCCPLDHYNLMMDCWRHEPPTRPRFADIGPVLAECRPEQVQAKVSSNEGPHMLSFRVGDVITVLDKKTHTPLWKGATASGKTGVFDPANVVAYLGSDLPSSSFLRSGMDATRSSARRKLRSEMISAPQGDFKHTGHVGLDGAYFGDLSFLGGSKGNYGSVPTQVVAPYRPHKDLEAAPLLDSDHVPAPAPLQDHEYHEISDEEETNNSPHLDLGPSLMAEMEMMFSNLGTQNHSMDHEGSNRSNELREKLNCKGKKQATVKPISAHDKKTLDTAIALATEITTRSLSATAPPTPASPGKKKFHFKFPSVHESDKHSERRNFSEEALSTSNLQKFMSSASSLDDTITNLRLPLWDKASAEFCFAKSRELLTRPFPSVHRVPPNSSCRDLLLFDDDDDVAYRPQSLAERSFRNLSYDEDYYHPLPYKNIAIPKSEGVTRKTYASECRFHRNATSQSFRSTYRPFPGNQTRYVEHSYVYYKSDAVDDAQNYFPRPRNLSYSDVHDALPRRHSRSVRERNRRRQSYNPKAYESSSSSSDCVSVGSVDLEWRRKRTPRLSGSNASIRSEMVKRSTNPFLKPQFSLKLTGRSPPPSSSVLSGLSPTSASRKKLSNSSSTDSSL